MASNAENVSIWWRHHVMDSTTVCEMSSWTLLCYGTLRACFFFRNDIHEPYWKIRSFIRRLFCLYFSVWSLPYKITLWSWCIADDCHTDVDCNHGSCLDTGLFMPKRCFCEPGWFGKNCERGKFLMTSWNGNIFRVTGPLCGESTGHRWIPRAKASYAELWCFLWSATE